MEHSDKPHYAKTSITTGLYFLTIVSSIFATGIFYDHYILAKWLFSAMLFCVLGVFIILFCYNGKDKWNVGFQQINILFFVSVSVILCMMALVQIYITKTWCSSGAPIATFDNTAGLVSCLVVLSPYVLYFVCNKSKIIGSIVLALIIFVVLSLKSRTGIIAIGTVSFFFTFSKLQGNNLGKRKHVGIIGTIAIFVLFSLLFIPLKSDSATGRFLIWIVSANMILRHPLAGYGLGGFEKHYMDYQAMYFETHPNSTFQMVADNVRCPFNEYIHILVDFGIIGFVMLLLFLFFICFLYVHSDSYYKNVYASSILGLAIVASFSYPSLYPFTYIAITISIIGLFPRKWLRIITDSKKRTFIRICTLVLFMGLAFVVTKRFYYEYILTSYMESDKTFNPDRLISNSPYILFDKATEYYKNGKYALSARLIKRCLSYRADYELNLHLGEAYLKINQFTESRKYLTKAHYMCPSRFYPLYYLAIINEKECKRQELRRICNEIINKPIKVYSQDVLVIKYGARMMLNNAKLSQKQ